MSGPPKQTFVVMGLKTQQAPRDIVERHGGSITLAENAPCGLLVRMSLDAHPDLSPGLQGASATGSLIPSKMAMPGEQRLDHPSQIRAHLNVS